jgi:hypothetical protein
MRLMMILDFRCTCVRPHANVGMVVDGGRFADAVLGVVLTEGKQT